MSALLKSIDHAIGSKDNPNRIDWFRSRLIGADKWLLDWLSDNTAQHPHDRPCLVHCGTLYKVSCTLFILLYDYNLKNCYIPLRR